LILFPGILGKNENHDQAATKQSHDNAPRQHDKLAALRPWRLAPEKNFPQRANG
jgi:hypothetical protein